MKNRSLTFLCLNLVVLFGHAAYAQVSVPGHANPWLAGHPNGTTASGGSDSAPGESPVLMADAPLQAGEALSFSVTGSVRYDSSTPTDTPDGDPGTFRDLNHSAENGIGGINAPANSLIGVFLDDNVPSGEVPPALDFSGSSALDYAQLSPVLRQPFFIGDGQTSGGARQQIVVPAGATRLYLGTMDGTGWFNNSGSFTVKLLGAPPAGFILHTAHYNGRTYHLLKRGSWSDSEAAARVLGGHLVTINDPAENTFVFDTFAPHALENAGGGRVFLWTGLNDEEQEGSYAWASGEPVGFTNFEAGQPTNTATEDHVAMSVNFETPGKWHDVAQPAGPSDVTFGVVETPLAVWAAGSDLAENEKPDRATETNPVNQTLPQWSYGYRSSATATGLTPFTPAEHQNGITSEDIEGFAVPGTVLTVAVNTGDADVVRNLGSGNHRPLLPRQLLTHPGTDGDFAVARWTAPTAGRYNIVARWLDLDTNGGNGISCHLVVNGEGRFEQNLDNGGVIDMPSQALDLNAGDTVDFVVGGRGDAAFDSTGFNAAISIAPAVELAPVPTTARSVRAAAKGSGSTTTSFAAMADSTVPAGSDVTFTADIKFSNPAATVQLRDNGKVVGHDNSAPYQFTIENIDAGLHTLQAVAVDARGVEGASQTVRVLATTSSSQARPASSGSSETAAASDISGDMFFFNKSAGSWDDPNNWTRLTDGAVGLRVPGADDAALLGVQDPVSVTLNAKFDVGILVVASGSRLAGQEFFPRFDVGVSVLRLASMTNCDLDGFELAIAPGAELDMDFAPRFKNLAIFNNGAMTCHNCGKTLADTVSEIRNSGTVTVQRPPASNQPSQLVAGSYLQTGGVTNIGVNTSLAASQLVAAGSLNLLSDQGTGIIARDGAGIIARDGAGIIARDGAGIINSDGASLIGPDGSSLIGPDGSSLIGMDGSSLIGMDGSSSPARHGGQTMLRAAASGRDSGLRAATTSLVVTLEPGAILTGTGNVIGTLVNRGGYVSPGRSGGVIHVTGDFSQDESGTLLLELGGTTANPPQFDQLQIRGQANFGGNLIVKTINGFTPQSGDTFSPLTYNSASGSFANISSNAQVSFGPNGMTMQVAGANPPAPKALNIATRMRVETGDNVLIAGFIITGSEPKKVLVRGIAPSLPVEGALADPTLDLDGTFFNDDWRSDQQGDIEATTIPPSSDLESAIVATLEPGAHTAVLRGKNDGTGVGLVEVYDLETGSPVQLANISTRGQVQTGDNVMIGGFIIGGNYPAKVLLRAIGPSLPVDGALQDPTLELVDSNGATISNDNWRATQEAEITATSVPPTNDKEAAIVATLVPGAYTAVVRGKDDTIGVALVEGYNLQ